MTMKSLIWRFRRYLALICVLLVALSLASMLGPLFLSALVDSVNERTSSRKIVAVFMTLAGANLLVFALKYVQIVTVGQLSIELSTYLRNLITRGFFSVDMGSPLKEQYVTTILADVSTVTTFITNNLASMLSYVGTFVGMSLVLARRSLILYGSIVAVIPAYVVTYRLFAAKKYEIARNVRTLQGSLTATLTEIEHNRHSIIHHAGTSKVLQFLQEKMAAFNNGLRSQIMLAANSGVVMSLLSFLVTLLTLGLGAHLVYSEGLSLGEYMAFLSYGGRLVSPVVGMTGIGFAWQSFRVALDRMNAMAQESMTLDEESGPVGIPHKVTFVNARPYPGSSFVVNGEMRLAGRVSITGDTGSGKSTICELITGRQAPYGGLVTFMSEADTNPNASVVLVSSQMKLFSRMSVYENLDFGTKDALMENIRQHLRVVEMDSLVDAILYTSKPVSEFGLSRGEEQRLLLARALLLNPGVLILDEALSGVEMEMFERIMRRMADMVPVIVTVSHRLSDHEGADIVYRVKAGSIAPDGSFAEKA